MVVVIGDNSVGYISKMNSTNFGGKVLDGNVVINANSVIIANGITLSATSATTIDLSSLLSSGYDYEICLSCESNVKTKGKWGKLSIVSGTKTYANISDADTIIVTENTARTDASYYCWGTVWVPIKSTDRKITLYNNGSGAVYNITIDLKGYRTVGTNGKSVTNPIDSISVGGSAYKIGGSIADGSWHLSYYSLASGVTLKSGTEYSYSLSSYLPNDGYDYMVLFSGWGRTGTSSSNNCNLTLQCGSGLYKFMRCGYHSESSYICASNIMIPVYSSSKTVILTNGSGTSGACGLYALAYRRIKAS